MNMCIQVGLSAYIRSVTCKTAYMRKRSKKYKYFYFSKDVKFNKQLQDVPGLANSYFWYNKLFWS